MSHLARYDFQSISFYEIQERFPVDPDTTFMRNVDCNKDNVLECKLNWQIKSHKIGDSKTTLKWLPTNDDKNANVVFSSGNN